MWKCYIKIMFKEHRTPLDSVLVSLVISEIPLDNQLFFQECQSIMFLLLFLNTIYDEVLYCSHLLFQYTSLFYNIEHKQIFSFNQ